MDIARAYMSNRKSEPGLLSEKIPDDERASLHGDHQMSKPFIPSMSPNPSTCWPGAMSESQRGYLTPRSQRGGRFGLHTFPRTPYSRNIFSKSKSKVCRHVFNSIFFLFFWVVRVYVQYADCIGLTTPLHVNS